MAAQRQELERLAGRTGSLADLARTAVKKFSSRRSYFSEDLRMDRLLKSVLEGVTDAGAAMDAIDEAHEPRRVLHSTRSGPWEGWFAELSSQFDPELGAATVEVFEDVDISKISKISQILQISKIFKILKISSIS